MILTLKDSRILNEARTRARTLPSFCHRSLFRCPPLRTSLPRTVVRALTPRRYATPQADLDEDDMLENVRVAELKKREKALKAAKKTTSFEEPDDSWERKTLLGKYDEKADEKVTLDESGAVDAAKKAKQEEVKRRLAVAAAGGVAAITGKEESADVGGAAKAQADFFTSAEMEQARK